MRLSPDVAKLNNLPENTEARVASASTRDKKHLFRDVWDQHAPLDLKDLLVEEYRFSQRRFRLDFAIPDKKIGIEVDGGNWMVRNGKAVGRHGKDKDLAKLNLAAELGWRILRFSPTMLSNDPLGCVMSVVNTIHAD